MEALGLQPGDGGPTKQAVPERMPWSQALFYGASDGLGMALAVGAECLLLLDWGASSDRARLPPNAAYIGAAVNVGFWFLYFGIARTLRLRLGTPEFRRSKAWQRTRHKILLTFALVVVVSGVLRLALGGFATGASVWGVLLCALSLSIYAGWRLWRRARDPVSVGG
jgi:hypothetical protein